nr:hypothetical protein [uncultured bacterium]
MPQAIRASISDAARPRSARLAVPIFEIHP